MMSFYSPHLREQLTNRMSELAFLQSITDDLLSGKPRRLAIWGLRRVGKTLVILEHFTRLAELKGVRSVYMDFEDICTSPEQFAQRYIGLATFWGLDEGQGDIDAYLTVERLLETIAGRSQAAGELGRAKESEVRELIRRFAGQIVPAEWFGTAGDEAGKFALPVVRSVDIYLSPDGQVELDALVECDSDAAESRDGRWAVSVKWRNRRAGVKELERLSGHAERLGATGWLISRAGFTPEAVEHALRVGILISSGEDLAKLAQALK
jgi:hypothetical protein